VGLLVRGGDPHSVVGEGGYDEEDGVLAAGWGTHRDVAPRRVPCAQPRRKWISIKLVPTGSKQSCCSACAAAFV